MRFIKSKFFMILVQNIIALRYTARMGEGLGLGGAIMVINFCRNMRQIDNGGHLDIVRVKIFCSFNNSYPDGLCPFNHLL